MAEESLESTATLIQRLHGGDREARDELIQRCLPLLQRWARGRLPGYAREMSDTDDLVQLALIRALNNIATFQARGQGSFLAYLRQILLNATRDEIRRVGRRPSSVEVDDTVPDKNQTPFEQLVDQQTREAYETALKALPVIQREAVVLRLEFGLSFADVALELGSPSANAARMMVARAFTRMAKDMGEVGG